MRMPRCGGTDVEMLMQISDVDAEMRSCTCEDADADAEMRMWRVDCGCGDAEMRVCRDADT